MSLIYGEWRRDEVGPFYRRLVTCDECGAVAEITVPEHEWEKFSDVPMDGPQTLLVSPREIYLENVACVVLARLREYCEHVDQLLPRS